MSKLWTRGVAVGLVMVIFAAAAAQSPAAPLRQFRGRLPAYFAKVIDEQQRQRIYGIQQTYHERIETLKVQLAALIDERDAEVEAVLSAEQRLEIERMKAAARAKRGVEQE
ncbi:MAG: hypothetical protein GXY83_02055 [Rhodopirellula sp.]|nr:hypothetical protein [Rhodopirellula sp.]